ncbi:hypothetical protein ScPMuIL_011234 [Solemya velum]
MTSSSVGSNATEKDLERLALDEIMKETMRGAERAKEFGALGWQKSPIPPANKVFLNNMMKQTIDGNTRQKTNSHNKGRTNDFNHVHDNSSNSKKSPTRGKEHYKHRSNRSCPEFVSGSPRRKRTNEDMSTVPLKQQVKAHKYKHKKSKHEHCHDSK